MKPKYRDVSEIWGHKKDRIGKLKATRDSDISCIRPKWSDHFEFWHVVSYRRRNHSRRIFCHNRFRSFGVLTPRNFIISIGLAGRSYNSVSIGPVSK